MDKKSMESGLKDKIEQKTARIAVVGLGYVGLPLAMGFAKAGFRVTGLDDNQEKNRMVNEGRDYINNESEILSSLVRNGLIGAVNDYGVLSEVDIICICVPTPLTRHREPDISYVVNVAEFVSRHLKRGQLVVLESTTYPGTTEEVVLPILEKSGLKGGQDFHLAFSPERVDPGNASYNTENTPKVIGGLTPECSELTRLLYEKVIVRVHKASSPRVAEMEKLLENIFRCVNIALMNELALLCRKMDISIWEVIELASTKPYGFMPFYPGPGLGGHCIPIDPFYLTWKAREYDFQTKFIELAGDINGRMPSFIVEMTTEALAVQFKCLRGSRILVLGAAYKKDIADHRESPSLKIMEELMKKGAEVSYNDDYIPVIHVSGKELHSVPLDGLDKYDCVIIAADHSYYQFEKIADEALLVVDSRNAVKRRDLRKVFVL
jgi:UDP-N-acetyl-D-glucosamine dehydrogenase